MHVKALSMEYNPKPIPDSPTHCRTCGFALEPLRRWGGLCRDCVPRAVGAQMQPANNQFRWTEVRRFKRKCRGFMRQFVVVRCQCGVEREMGASEFVQRKALGCNKCKLQWIRKHGVESDAMRVNGEPERMTQRRKKAGSSRGE